MKAFKNVHLVTCDEDFHIYGEGLLVVDGAELAYVGAYDASWEARAEEVVDYEGAWIMPGLVNVHTHNAMTLLRGISDDENLHDWLEKSIWPAESQFTPEITTTAVELSMLEMLQSGTTTFNDMYNPSGMEIARIHQVVSQAGMRCYFSPTLFSNPAETVEQTLERTRGIIQEILSYEDENFQTMVAPHAPYTCSEELLRGSLALAQEFDLPLHIHVAETQAESQMMLERTGRRPLVYLQDLGYLDHPAVFAHSLDLTEEEITLLAQSPVAVAHNPISNLKLASGIAPVAQLLEAGATVGLATDSVASNNNLDLFEEVRTAALLQKMVHGDARKMPISQVLQALTIGGAKALGMGDRIGSLDVGKQADFIVIDPRKKAHLYPVDKMLSHLVYAVKGSDVDQVYIAGRQVVRDGQVLTIDQESVFEKIERIWKK